ncbi:hypothetical protein DKM44_03865 [Deinococcus irradiatisoli]|uniref:Uncharacterized protein n=1 Tax=Deinococcus irradiatisoli TaxID=2202254 RepID=A0A2Z3JHM7_9DEIO|nr:hypothetical protein [Deinococcus irradiatisoli]AWN22479.1 hypothetical protein DKM44_03865 [Deinococcus irradiatisoli]
MTQTRKTLPHVEQHPDIEQAPQSIAEHLAASGIVQAWGDPQPYEVDVLESGSAQLVWVVNGARVACRVWFMSHPGPDETVLFEGPWGEVIAIGEHVSWQSMNDLAFVLRDGVEEVTAQVRLAQEAAARAAEEARLAAETQARLAAEAEAQRKAQRQAEAKRVAEAEAQVELERQAEAIRVAEAEARLAAEQQAAAQLAAEEAQRVADESENFTPVIL